MKLSYSHTQETVPIKICLNNRSINACILQHYVKILTLKKLIIFSKLLSKLDVSVAI